MWHSLKFVAESRRVNGEALTAFAMAHQDKYGIATDRVEPEVNTWNVDQLVRDFKTLPAPEDENENVQYMRAEYSERLA